MITYSCKIACAPIRLEQSDKSEMISQLLFGETFKIIKTTKSWKRIKTHDGYEGWIDPRVIANTKAVIKEKCYVNKLWAHVISSGMEMFVPYGSELNPEKDEFSIHDFTFVTKSGPEKIIQDALLFLNTPYLWGGRSSFGVDCSGLMQVLAKVNGYTLPREASQQVNSGKAVEYGKHNIGDLAFFQDESGKIVHVGILSAKDEIIHASGWVRSDLFDEKGILVESSGLYSHHLACIRRIF